MCRYIILEIYQLLSFQWLSTCLYRMWLTSIMFIWHSVYLVLMFNTDTSKTWLKLDKQTAMTLVFIIMSLHIFKHIVLHVYTKINTNEMIKICLYPTATLCRSGSFTIYSISMQLRSDISHWVMICHAKWSSFSFIRVVHFIFNVHKSTPTIHHCYLYEEHLK